MTGRPSSAKRCRNDATLAEPDNPQCREMPTGAERLVDGSEDLEDHNDYRGHCLHCRQEITAQGGVEWRRVVRAPCPHCRRPCW